MNGLAARLTFPRRRSFRAALVGTLCVSAVLLIGAVREQRHHPMSSRTSAASPALSPDTGGDSVFASYGASEDRVLRSARPAVSVPSLPTERADAKSATVQAPSLNVLPPLPARVSLAPRTRTLMMEVTAYCPCTRCCGPRAQGITASGKRVSFNGGKFVAADTKLLKFHTKLIIPGYAANAPVPVIDRGGAIRGHKLDVYFPTHQEARQWGRKKIPVMVMEE